MRIAAPLNTEPVPELHWIEVATSLQLPSFQIIGLPAPEVAEARERVRAAIEASDLKFPRRRVVLNLSPASIRKRGAGMDLAMAIAVLGVDHAEPKASWAAWGELGLQGEVKSAGQVTRTLYAAWKAGVSRLLLARDDYELAVQRIALLRESGEFTGDAPAIHPVLSLRDAWALVTGGAIPNPPEVTGLPVARRKPEISELMSLSPALERVVGLSAAGDHHLLLLGSRGAGKSHAMEWLIALQPPMTAQVRLRHALLSELGGVEGSLHSNSAESVVRRIGANARPGALIGSAGALFIRPGEFSLAHGGLLIADEFMEWARDCREALREPLERGEITLTRVHATLNLPASFTLAANGNLCPCGGWPPQFPPGRDRLTSVPRCRCPQSIRSQYLARLSGPILDRMEIVALVSSYPRSKEKRGTPTQRLECLREQVRKTREACVRAVGEIPGKLSSPQIEELLKGHPSWKKSLEQVSRNSLRARHKVIKVAMTINAWEGKSPLDLDSARLTEASFYRPERLGLCD